MPQKNVAQLTITRLDPTEKKGYVVAQFNPRELQLQRTVPWATHDVFGAKQPESDAAMHRGLLHLEYGGRQARTIDLELLFDGFETGESVEEQLLILDSLALPIDPTAREEKLRRPPRCLLVWGEQQLAKMVCVIESLTTKVTMFAANGKPLRATCAVKLRETDIASTAKAEREQFAGRREK